MLDFAVFPFEYSTSSTVNDMLTYGFLFVRDGNYRGCNLIVLWDANLYLTFSPHQSQNACK